MHTEYAFRLDEHGDVHLEAHSRAMDVDACRNDELARVKDSGHVIWRVRDGHVRVRLRPSLISPAAYARVMGWLVRHPPERVLLSYFVRPGWEYEFLRKRGEAARRIRWLVELYGGGGYCNVRRRTVSVSLGPTKGWGHAIDFWRELREDIDPIGVSHHFDQFFAGRWILFAREPRDGFSVSAFGPNQPEYLNKWLKGHRGIRISEPSDRIFSQMCASVYQSVAAAFEPHADEIDAITHWTGHGRRRAGFRRLALPFRLQNQTWVLAGIEKDPTLELFE